jgi:hypothetical protein
MPLFVIAGVVALLLLAAASRLVFDFARSMDRPTLGAFRHVPILSRALEQVEVAAVNSVTQVSSARSEPIPTVQLVVDPEQLSLFQLRSSRRGKIVLPGKIWWDGQWGNADVALRGENVFHWGSDLKSYKIRLKGRDTGGQDVFNLVNPKDAGGFDLLYGEETGKRLGLLTPGSIPCRFMLNSKNQGLYVCQQNVNASWIRDQGRVPGNLYSGDILFMGFDSSMNTATHLWDRASLWQEEMKVPGVGDTQTDLTDFLRAVSDVVSAPATAEPAALYKQLAAAADIDAFLRLWVTQTWSKSIHQDEFHNWRLYFDPSKGVIEPVVWDALRDEGTSSLAALDAPLPRPQLALLRFPEMNQRRYEILYRELVAPELKEHAFEKWAMDFFAKTRHTNLSASSIDEIDYVPNVMMWRPASRLDVLTVKDREIAFIRNHTQALAAALRAVEIDRPECVRKDSVRLECGFVLKSRAGLRLVGIAGPAGAQGEASLAAQGPAGHWRFAAGAPGEGAPQFFPVMDTVPDHRAPGRVKAVIAPVRQFFTLDGQAGAGPLRLVFLNTITGERTIVPFMPVERPSVSSALTGFSFAPMPASAAGEIRLGPGVVKLEKTLRGNLGQPVRIVAGTTLRMGHGVSLVVNGPLYIDGTEQAPVRIVPAKAGEPWGGLLVIGAAAGGTALHHCQVAGGSVAQAGNVLVTGLASFYHLSALTIDHCSFTDNESDDALHLLHVKQAILSDIKIQRAKGDCADFDYADGTLDRFATKTCANDGINLTGSKIILRNASFSDNGDKGASVGENSLVLFEDSILQGNSIGLLAKDGARAVLGSGVRFADNKLDVTGFKKAKHAGHGGCILSAGDENSVKVTLQDDSRFTGGYDVKALSAAWDTANPRGLCWTR